jgi:acetyltransferase-like isoleucine patch superfamily enzyme
MTESETKQKDIKSDQLFVPKGHEISELEIDFITTGAMKSINYTPLILYIPVIWISSFLVIIFWVNYFFILNGLVILQVVLFPLMVFGSYMVFIFGVAISAKLLMIIIEMIHLPREGIFIAQKGNKEYDFWCLRVQLKKFVLWVMDNCPVPWIDIWGFKWFGLKVDFSSHMFDAWVDTEFIEFGHKITVGQGATLMSSMVVGKYLIIKKIIFEDYSVIGGVSNIAPGTKIGEETIIGAFSTTNYNQELEPGWVYFGIPASKLKENKYSEIRTGMVYKKDVDEESKYLVKEDINIDEDGNK